MKNSLGQIPILCTILVPLHQLVRMPRSGQRKGTVPGRVPGRGPERGPEPVGGPAAELLFLRSSWREVAANGNPLRKKTVFLNWGHEAKGKFKGSQKLLTFFLYK